MSGLMQNSPRHADEAWHWQKQYSQSVKQTFAYYFYFLVLNNNKINVFSITVAIINSKEKLQEKVGNLICDISQKKELNFKTLTSNLRHVIFISFKIDYLFKISSVRHWWLAKRKGVLIIKKHPQKRRKRPF